MLFALVYRLRKPGGDAYSIRAVIKCSGYCKFLDKFGCCTFCKQVWSLYFLYEQVWFLFFLKTSLVSVLFQNKFGFCSFINKFCVCSLFNKGNIIYWLPSKMAFGVDCFRSHLE